MAAAAFVAGVALAPVAAAADENGFGGALLGTPDPGLLSLGAGAYNFLHKDKEAQARLEYRFPQRFFLFKPLAGVLVTNDRTFYAYGGVRIDLYFGEHFVVMPAATVGYWDRGSGKDLGSHAEFKTGAEFAYRFADHSRLGLAFDHISNAGITQRNPGTESLLLVYSIPIGP